MKRAVNDNVMSEDKIELLYLLKKYPECTVSGSRCMAMSPQTVGNFLWFIKFEVSFRDEKINAKRNSLRVVKRETP